MLWINDVREAGAQFGLGSCGNSFEYNALQ